MNRRWVPSDDACVEALKIIWPWQDSMPTIIECKRFGPIRRALVAAYNVDHPKAGRKGESKQ